MTIEEREQLVLLLEKFKTELEGEIETLMPEEGEEQDKSTLRSLIYLVNSRIAAERVLATVARHEPAGGTSVLCS